MAEVAADIWDAIERYVGAEGLELDDVEVAGGHGSPAVRVIVDGPDGVDVDHLADLSRGIDRLLDGTRYDTTRYGLEVSSPGLERKLRRPAHWAKVVGARVTVKTRPEIDGTRRHDGTVVEVGEESVAVDVDGVQRTIPFDEITSAKTVFVWEKAPKPGGKKE
jgi:ribosome maturation factor RimP